MKYQLAIFDLDGTILNTIDDLANSVNYALALHNLPMRTLAEIKSFVGNGIHNLIKLAVPSKTTTELTEEVFLSFTTHYNQHCSDNTKPYEGIIDVLQQIRQMGIQTAIVSNKADFAVQILTKQYFAGLFDIAIGESSEVPKKPAPDSTIKVLKALNIDKEQAIFIGDSEVDIQTAANAQIPCISVSWGFREINLLESSGATNIIHKPSEIINFLKD